MNDLIRKRDIDYISSPIAPVLKGENVHYEYVAFRKQIEDISPVPAIPIPENATNLDIAKQIYGEEVAVDLYNDLTMGRKWWNAPYKRGEKE